MQSFVVVWTLNLLMERVTCMFVFHHVPLLKKDFEQLAGENLDDDISTEKGWELVSANE